ncbi:hypothetical protein INS49_009839 [Diaporthe citri]|uniref:uncharacterized protein n=1 Tax=Diaporthe citri TaxID=83186 RepID=UPI001C8201D5|nr:uncharacterized protein INS49_009839 [Diaporthe citri]KAG6361612.1 hypothetical protein INS49_009839 [Diaporthe citri]
MSSQIYTLPPPSDPAVCTAVFTYIVVVFFLARLSIDELGPEARRHGGIPPSSLLYLACILLWPVTVGLFAGLLVLGVLSSGFIKALALSVRWVEACRRRITTCFPSRRRAEDLEMGPLVPCRLEGVSWGETVADHGCSQAEMAFREVVAALKKECGLTPGEWDRASCPRSLAPLR